MKIAVINFSGNVGKSTIARNLLAPRIPDAEVFAVETINSDGTEDETMKGKEFGDLLEALQLMDSAVVDLGASNIEAVMTVETKGISLANAVASYLNVPAVTARKRSKVTEGATVSVNYMSSSTSRVAKMELPTRALDKDTNVLIVDDFMKGGGTLDGMRQLVKEFDCQVAGVCVLCETEYEEERKIKDYVSLVNIDQIDSEKEIILAQPGNFLTRTNFDRF